MDTANNPFRELNPNVLCPPELKAQIFSEIDLIRNTLTIVELFGYTIFSAFTTYLSGLEPTADSPEQP
jgi:hypothetical protein